MIAYALPLLVIAVGCYLGARFAWLAGWQSLAGILRLAGIWAATAWAGYGSPLYAALLCVPLGIAWSKLHPRMIAVIGLELVFSALLIALSATQIVPIYLVGLLIFDQLFARLALTVYDRQREPRKRMHQAIAVAGILGCALFVAHFHRHTLLTYVSSHSPLQALSLVPTGAAPLWYHKRVLNNDAARDAEPGSVYWQARYPETGETCAVSFHGAAAPGSLQSSARTFGQAARKAGLRLYAVDHPGYGASPVPPTDAPVDSWDPARLTSDVLDQMSIDGCKAINVLGHSQGVTEALRLLTSNDSKVARVLVFGAGLFDKDKATDDYWYNRFHIDRGIDDANRVPRDNWQLIRDLYYLNEDYCSNTKAGRGYLANRASANPLPLHFVTFEREHENLVRTRERLWDCLQYPEAQRHILPTSHYLDSLQVGALMFVQPKSVKLVANLLPSLASE